MRKTELKEGAEYVLGAPGRFDRSRTVRIVVVKINGAERVRKNGTVERGILVRFVEGCMYQWRTRQPGEEMILPSAREITYTWETYEKLRADYEAKVARENAERQRTLKLLGEIADDLRSLGIDAGSYSSGVMIDKNTRSSAPIRFTPEAMKKLLAMIPKEKM